MKNVLMICFVFLFGCSSEPKSIAVGPDMKGNEDQSKDTTKDLPKDQQNDLEQDESKDIPKDQINDMKTGMGGKKITVYRWLLRDKDNKIVDAMVILPTFDTSQPNYFHPPQNAVDYTQPPTAQPAVSLRSVNGQLLHHLSYRLSDGKPASVPNCTYVYSDANCTTAYLSREYPICTDTNGNPVSGSGAPDLDLTQDVYIKSASTCSQIASSSPSRPIYAPRIPKPVANNIINLLPNPPYTLTYEPE